MSFGDEVGPSGEMHDPPEHAPTSNTPATEPALDLNGIERDLADVETALERLEAGTYWTDEISGDPIPDEQLAADPLRRRAQ